jgi:hypothetical protein
MSDGSGGWNWYADYALKRVGIGTTPSVYDFQVAKQICGLRASNADYIEWHMNNLEPGADWFFRVDGSNNNSGYLKLYKNSTKVLEIDTSGNAYFPVTLKAVGYKSSDGSSGLSATYTFGGGGSGDIATMTFKNGLLTAVTTVP